MTRERNDTKRRDVRRRIGAATLATVVAAGLLLGMATTATAARPQAKTPAQLITAKQVSDVFGSDFTKVAIQFGGSIDTTPARVATTCQKKGVIYARCYFVSKATKPDSDSPAQTVVLTCGTTEGAKKIKIKKSNFELSDDDAAYTPHWDATVNGLATGPTYLLADRTYVTAGFTVKGKDLPKKGTGCIISLEAEPSQANLQATKSLVKLVAAATAGKKPEKPAVLQAAVPLLTEAEVATAIGKPLPSKGEARSTCDLQTFSCSFSSNSTPGQYSSDDTTLQVTCGQQEWGANQFEAPTPVDVGKVAIADSSNYGTTRIAFLPYQTAPTSSDTEAFVCTLDYSPGGTDPVAAPEKAVAAAKVFDQHLTEQAIPLTLGSV